MSITEQEAFNKAYIGLAKQGFKASISQDDSSPLAVACAYEERPGCRCAIGHMLPDDPKILSHRGDVNSLRRTFAVEEYLPANLEFCEQLQYTHDGRTGSIPAPIEMRANLHDFARQWCLRIPKGVPESKHSDVAMGGRDNKREAWLKRFAMKSCYHRHPSGSWEHLNDVGGANVRTNRVSGFRRSGV